MKTKSFLHFVLCLVISTSILSCSSGDDSTNDQPEQEQENDPQNQDPDPNPIPNPNPNPGEDSFDLTGKFTFLEYIAFRELPAGISEVNLPDLVTKRLGDGVFPWRHPDGEIIMVKGCGSDVNRLVILDESGSETVVSPCSSEIANPGFLPSKFEFSRLSPDKTLIAAEMKYFIDDGYRYSTVILKDGEIQKIFNESCCCCCYT